jgi:menaquinone-dependent protoporphyrinogen oxidase
MSVLVAAASRYGATAEIARAIGEGLERAGLDVTVASVDDVSSLDGYDAVVLGSAVYAGRWLKAARKFVKRNRSALSAAPVWLFSSGPIGDPPKPDGEEAVDVTAIIEATEPEEHRILAGKLDKDQLTFGERAIVVAVRSPEGDFRDWDEIAAWAGQIAGTLQR